MGASGCCSSLCVSEQCVRKRSEDDRYTSCESSPVRCAGWAQVQSEGSYMITSEVSEPELEGDMDGDFTGVPLQDLHEGQALTEAETRANEENARKDWFLTEMVDIGNSANVASFELTLQVSGLLISGTLISGAMYFNELKGVLSAGQEDPGWIADWLDARAKDVLIDPENVKQVTPNYIHLRDARFFSPNGGPLPNNHGVLWRGRLRSIDGFWFGVLVKANSKEATK